MSYFSYLHLFSSPKKGKNHIDSKGESNKQENVQPATMAILQ